MEQYDNIPVLSKKIDRNIRLLEINQIEESYNIRWKFFLARDNFNYKKDFSFLIDFLDFFIHLISLIQGILNGHILCLFLIF